ncbi:hypothetical protein RINTHH_10560 [Richelia intracellularis HH01]|uniref:Uncharacterized protein n=1 Tax=Richelia intracellularis HH01 TaxID=1165094 RepID=M1X5B4_9NOST|nr:hypothetical protein RINTHH_10560 [Richelia intracellularis HH01]
MLRKIAITVILTLQYFFIILVFTRLGEKSSPVAYKKHQ